MIQKQIMYLLMRPQRVLGLVGGLVLLAQVDLVVASPTVFTLDSTNSVLTLSGGVTLPYGLGVAPFAEQSPGSLTTHYSGTVILDLTPPTIQFPGGSLMLAQTNGSWQPAAGGVAGSAPADYGGAMTISAGIFGSGTAYAAARSMKLDVTSLALTLTNSGFGASNLNVFFSTNTPPVPVLDYKVTGTGAVPTTNGTTSLTGSFVNGQSLAYLTNTSGTLKLVVPLNATNITTFLNPNDTKIILKGQLVATAPESAWPLVVNISVSGDQVTLTWPSVTGQVFTVLASPDLHNWVTNSGTTAVESNTTTWTASQSGSVRFYRVLLQ